MIEKILNKFDILKQWQKFLVIILSLVFLPLVLLVGLFYLWSIGQKDISELLVNQKKNNIDDRVKRAEEKDKVFAGEEEAVKVEKEILYGRIKENDENHAEITKHIDGATSIGELRAIARNLRGSNSSES